MLNEENRILTEENRKGWDKLAPVHARGSGAPFYRIEDFLNGDSKLSPWETEEVGPVDGKTLVHLQCHIGTDTLSRAREGARVTGLDFSSAALEEARRFARLLDLDARFVEGLVQNARELLDHEEFDVVYTGRGAVCWLPDLDVWARQCFALTRPGGIFYMEETHPTCDLLDVHVDSDGRTFLAPKYDSFSRKPVSEMSEGTYADRNAETGSITSHAWEHSIGEVIGSLVDAGFDYSFLREREIGFFDPWNNPDILEKHSDDHWRFRKEQVRFPLSYTLKLTRPG